MNRKTFFFLLPFAAALLALAVVSGTVLGNHSSAALAQPPAAPQAEAQYSPAESWRLGVLYAGQPNYAALAGRLAGPVAGVPLGTMGTYAYQSDQYFVFPAAAAAYTIESARFHLITHTVDTGVYTHTVQLSLEAFSLDGLSQRTLSTAPVDLLQAKTGTWTAVGLSAAPEELVLAPGEFLAFHLAVPADAGGQQARLEFEVVVR